MAVQRESHVVAVPEPRVHRSDSDLFREIYPMLRRFAAVVGDLDVHPDDLVQEAVERALRRGALAELEHPVGYLRRSILNIESNRRRSQSRSHAREIRSAGIPEHATDHYPSDLQLLSSVGPTDRCILYLREVEMWRYAEIAELVDSNEATVRGRACTARRQLRELIGSEETT